MGLLDLKEGTLLFLYFCRFIDSCFWA